MQGGANDMICDGPWTITTGSTTGRLVPYLRVA